MSWTTLSANGAMMRTYEPAYLAMQSDASLSNSFKDAAKEIVKRDLSDALNFRGDVDNSVALDALATTYAGDLTRALNYLQLSLAFTSDVSIADDVNDRKAHHYKSLYNEELRRFKMFVYDREITNSTTSVPLMR